MRRGHGISPVRTFFGNKSKCMRMGGSVGTPNVALRMSPLPRHPTGFSNKMNGFGVSTYLSGGRVGTNRPVALHIVIKNVKGLGLLGRPMIGFPGSFSGCSTGMASGAQLATGKIRNGVVCSFLTIPHGRNDCAVPTIRFACCSADGGTCGAVGARPFALGIRGKSKSASRSTSCADGSGSVRAVVLNGASRRRTSSVFFKDFNC